MNRRHFFKSLVASVGVLVSAYALPLQRVLEIRRERILVLFWNSKAAPNMSLPDPCSWANLSVSDESDADSWQVLGPTHSIGKSYVSDNRAVPEEPDAKELESRLGAVKKVFHYKI